MITINLLPEELRVAPKKKIEIPALKIVVTSAVLFVLLTLIFYVDFLMVSAKWSKLQKKWKTVEPQFKLLNELQKEVEGDLKQEKEFMEKYVVAPRPFTHIAKWSSELLPDSAWLTELKMERAEEGGNILVKGLTLPSKAKSSIEVIEDYLNALKAKMPDASLSLTTARQTVEKVELTEFIANFTWGKKKL